jgi:serine/threonine protein kinase
MSDATAITGDGPGGLPGYDLLRLLWQDGVSAFYHARQWNPDRAVVLYTAWLGPPSAGQRRPLEREAAVLDAVRHPHVVRLYDRLEQAGRVYLALEFPERGRLDVRAGRRPQPCRPAAALVERLAHAVAHVHHCGIVHGDLKPGRVWLAAPPASPAGPADECEAVFGVPKLGGFELALELAGPLPADGTIQGTPAYMAPEQARGHWREVGPRTDVHGLGAILYELLTGRPPFRCASMPDALRRAAENDPDPPAALRPDVDPALAGVCQKCLHKDPARRYASADELAADLRAYRDGRPGMDSG